MSIDDYLDEMLMDNGHDEELHLFHNEVDTLDFLNHEDDDIWT